MKELVKCIIENLVEHPKEIQITETRGNSTIVIEISVAKEDMGKILGKQGKMIAAIKTILQSIASTRNLRLNIEVLERQL